MSPSNPRPPVPTAGPRRRTGVPWLFAAALLLVVLCVAFKFLLDREKEERPPADTTAAEAATGIESSTSANGPSSRPRQYSSGFKPASIPEVTVSNKVARFARGRREVVHALAQKFNVNVPADVEKFFDLVEAGNWDELHDQFEALNQQRRTPGSPPDLNPLWPALVETYGVTKVAHDWPAQKLLDYGQAVLGSLRPGMVYLGGTDAGRFIPTLLNETSDGEHHVVLTQNAFADSAYLDYVNFLYGDRLSPLTSAESQRAFNDYLADASQRAQHDRQSPAEPRQLKPGENVNIDSQGGNQRIQISGPTAVGAVNERLLQTLLQKNPNTSFALEESFPLESTYATAMPLGPIMELRVTNPQSGLSAATVAQSAAYWQETAQQLMSDPASATADDTRNAWARMATAQANLFAARNFSAPAEQTYRAATQLAPTYLDSAVQYAQFLFRSGRAPQGHQLLDEFGRNNPAQFPAAEALRANLSTAGAPPPATR